MSKLLVPLAVAGLGLLVYSRARENRAHSRTGYPTVADDMWKDSKRAVRDLSDPDKPNVIDRAADKLDDTMSDFGRSVDKGARKLDRKIDRGISDAKDMAGDLYREVSPSPKSNLSRDMSRVSDKVKDTASDIGDSVDKGMRKLDRKFDRGVSEAKDKADDFSRNAQRSVSNTMDKAEDFGRGVERDVKRGMRDARDFVQEKSEDVRDSMNRTSYPDSRSQYSPTSSSQHHEYTSPYVSETLDTLEKDIQDRARNWRHNWHIGEFQDSGNNRSAPDIYFNDRNNNRSYGENRDRWSDGMGWSSGNRWSENDRRWSREVPPYNAHSQNRMSDTYIDNTNTVSRSDIPNSPGLYHSVVMEKSLHGTDSLKKVPRHPDYAPIEKISRENERQRDYLANEIDGLIKSGDLNKETERRLKDVLDTANINYMHQQQGISALKGENIKANDYKWFHDRQRAH